MPAYVREAVRRAEEERPGTSHIELPEDVAHQQARPAGSAAGAYRGYSALLSWAGRRWDRPCVERLHGDQALACPAGSAARACRVYRVFMELGRTGMDRPCVERLHGDQARHSTLHSGLPEDVAHQHARMTANTQHMCKLSSENLAGAPWPSAASLSEERLSVKVQLVPGTCESPRNC